MAQPTYQHIQELFISLPLLKTNNDQQAFVLRAGLDIQFVNQIQYDLPPATFVTKLIACAAHYSDIFDAQHPLIKLIAAAKNYVGPEKQAQCDEFIRQLCDGVYTDALCECPKRPWNVPYQRNPYFTGREQELQQLHEALHRDHRAALSQTQAISGLGGIGKTQTAVEYAFRHAEEYSAVLWVLADSNEALFSGFAALARELGLPEQHAQEQEKAVKAVLRWLSTHSGWLLIFDNADDPALLKPYLPPQSQGHILITSRARVLSVAGVTQPLALPKLPPDDARQFLLERAGRELTPRPPLFGKERGNSEFALRPDSVGARSPRPNDGESRPDGARGPRPYDDAQALTEIVQELDGLPLALEQAGAYLHETQCSFSDYLAGYRKRKLQLLERHAPEVGTHPQSVAATWILNFEQVQQASTPAADILRLSAFLYPEDIPEELLTDGAAKVLESLQTLADDPLAFNEALVPLTRFHLITRDAERHTYSIHRIVQAALQATLSKEEQRHWAERTVNVVDAAFPKVDFKVSPVCERLLPQALHCAELIAQWQMTNITAVLLINQTASYLEDRARYTEAEPLYQCNLRIIETIFGLKHLLVGSGLNNLALLYEKHGRYAEAEPLFQRSLRILEAVLGPEHPDVATSLNNLAVLYQLQGRYAEAESLFQRSLRIDEQVYGPDHLDVACSLNNLAELYQCQDRYAEAEPLHQRSLRIREVALGSEHPHVALSLNNLAAFYYAQRRYAEAELMYQHSLRIRDAVLGPTHPDVACSLNNLAELYKAQGRFAGAELLHQRNLRILEQVFNGLHPNLAIGLENYAGLLRQLGRDAEAEALEARAAAIRARLAQREE